MNTSSIILIAAGIGFFVAVVSLILIHKIKNERFAAILSGSPCIILIGTILILLTSHSDYQIDEALFIIPFSIINDLLFLAFWKYDALYSYCLCCPKRNTINAVLIGLPMGYAIWCIYTLAMYYLLRRVEITILFIRLISVFMIVLTASSGIIGLVHEVWTYNIKTANEAQHYHQQLSSEDITWSNEQMINAINNSNNGNIAIESQEDDANISDESDGKEIEDDNFDVDAPIRDDQNGSQNVSEQQQQHNHPYIQKPMDIKAVADNKLPMGLYIGRGMIAFFGIYMAGLLSSWGDGILAGFFCVFPSIYSIMVVFLYTKYNSRVEFDSLYANILTKTANSIFAMLSGILYLDFKLGIVSSIVIGWILSVLFITIPISYLFSWRDKQIQRPELTTLRKYVSFNL